jgi:hypothetical protein
MPAPILPITFQNPGSRGLNSQDSTGYLDVTWATELTNAVFDNAGRIANRKGWTKLTTSSALGAFDIKQIHCWESATTSVVISAANNKLFHGTTSLTDITGTVTTPTANNWQFSNWNDGTNTKIIAWQAGHTPIVSTVTTVTPGNFADITASSGSLPTGNCMTTGWGRVWASDADGLTIKYSGLLNETQWNSGGAGSLDTRYYWPRGADYITALAFYQDKLIVFGKRNILVYDGTLSPSSALTLVDQIEGVGCVARDSVQNLGNDLLFLSETGLRSLSRTLTNDTSGEGSKIPLQEVGTQVRDEIVAATAGNETNIRSCYNQVEGFYVLVIPDTTDPVTYIFDLKGLKSTTMFGTPVIDLDNVKVSKWDGWDATAVAYSRNQVMYGGFRDSTDSNEGVIGYYNSYLDNTSTYTMSWKSPWIDLSNSDSGESGAFYKIPKEAIIYTIGGLGTTYSFSWAFDFSNTFSTANTQITSGGTAPSEWGESEYGSSEFGYSESFVLSRKKTQMSKHGQTIRFGFSAQANNVAIALQRIDVFIKKGRIAR